MKKQRWLLVMLACAAWIAPPRIAIAQAYPAKPVKLVSTVPLGSSGDVVIRLLAAKMTLSLGQPIIVETNTAANGAVASRAVANSAPDGYSLLYGSMGSLVAAVYLKKDLPYDPRKDFTAISLVANAASFLAVSAQVPVNSAKELFEYARRNPGKLTYASNGVGSVFHLMGETLKMASGVDILHVPYAGGNMAVPVNDLLTGRIDMTFPTLTLLGPHLSGGKVRPLAVLDDQRFERLQNVPAITEVLTNYKPLRSWFGLVGPANMPAAIAARIQQEIAKSLAEPDVLARMNDLGATPWGYTPEKSLIEWKRDFDVVGNTVRALHIEPQ